MIEGSAEYQEFIERIRSVLIDYRPTLSQFMGAIAQLDKLLSGLPLEPRKMETPPREGQDL